MRKVKFIPNLQAGELEATVLVERGNAVVLLCQDRVSVAALDNGVYRPYPETKTVDLLDLIP